MARFINTPGVGVWELGRRFNSHLSWWVGDFWYLDLEELEVPLISACPCSTTKVSLNMEVFSIQSGESFDLYNLLVKVVFSFKKLIHAPKIFSDCHFRHPSVSEGRWQGGWTRHSLGNNLHTVIVYPTALADDHFRCVVLLLYVRLYSWGEVPAGCMQVGKVSLKGTQLQLFPNMLPYKLPLFRNPLNYTICRIYTADIFAIYTYSLFFVGFPNVFQALSRAGWLGARSETGGRM